MVLKSGMRFNPELLLSAPRRSAGVPNPSGTKVLYTSSTYSFNTHKKTLELRVLDAATGDSKLLTSDEDVSSPNWLDDDQYVYLKSADGGVTHVKLGTISGSIKTEHQVAGQLDAPAGNLRITPIGDHKGYAVVVSAPATPDGKLHNPVTAKKTHSTGRLYSKLFVRHWDRYETPEKSSLWFAHLGKTSDGNWKLSKEKNALKGLGLECPIATFGGTDNFDISKSGIIFVAKDPDLNEALNTKCNVYLIHFDSWETGERSLVQRVVVPGFEGAATSPVFSADGEHAAFLMMESNGYEADKNQIFTISLGSRTLDTEISATRAFAGDNNVGSWDRSPSVITFTADSKHILALTPEEGHVKLFMLKADLSQKFAYTLTFHGSISDAVPLANGNIFVSGSSLIDNSFYAIVAPHITAQTQQEELAATISWKNSNTAHGNQFGLHPEQVGWIKTPASNPKINKYVNSIVMKPSTFKDPVGTKYPVAYVIHGGPQSAWMESWSTRWNPAILAEQGYIVILPNPTGSTGYGQAFTDAITKNWGGDPYQDIVNVFDWVGENLPYADNENAVALGASYGGYMMNWIQGHDLGRRFKAIVCHDGVTSFAGGQLCTEELYFPFHDLGGTAWFDPKFDSSRAKGAPAEAHRNFGAATMSDWRRWDPSEHFANWSTPQLVIHSSKDFRLPIGEGLAAFNVLQARGIESEFLTFPDENHWVLKPENSLVWHKVVLNWINRHVGLPLYTKDDPQSEAFYGGLREEGEEPAEMMTQGEVAM